jgi:hypothetical protein
LRIASQPTRAGIVAIVLLAQLNAPEWAGIGLKLASIAVLVSALVVLLVFWRNNRDR